MSTKICKIEGAFRRNFARLSPGAFKIKERTKRCLFGPPDHALAQRWVEEQLRQQQALDAANWNFDFHLEVSLGGDYVWSGEPMVPARPVKRKHPVPTYETSPYYFQPIEPVIEDAAPGPLRASSTTASGSPADNSQSLKKKQTLITDYMTVKKQASVVAQEESERPSKKPRLDDSSS